MCFRFHFARAQSTKIVPTGCRHSLNTLFEKRASYTISIRDSPLQCHVVCVYACVYIKLLFRLSEIDFSEFIAEQHLIFSDYIYNCVCVWFLFF